MMHFSQNKAAYAHPYAPHVRHTSTTRPVHTQQLGNTVNPCYACIEGCHLMMALCWDITPAPGGGGCTCLSLTQDAKALHGIGIQDHTYFLDRSETHLTHVTDAT